MNPEESLPQPAQLIDMSPEAIFQRLQLVGQLNDLCRFLGKGSLVSQRAVNAPRNAESSGHSGHRTD